MSEYAPSSHYWVAIVMQLIAVVIAVKLKFIPMIILFSFWMGMNFVWAIESATASEARR